MPDNLSVPIPTEALKLIGKWNMKTGRDFAIEYFITL
jgi:hypothetical protein